MNIAIVTDSTADIPEALCQTLDIHVVPNILVIDGQSHEDGKGITREVFYEMLPAMHSFPTTATASIGAYQDLYRRLIENGAPQVISLHASSLLSGIFNAAWAAGEAFKTKVRVIDSEMVSLGLGFQVLEAARSRLKSLDVDNILAKVIDLRRRTRLVAMLDTLDYVRRSGRVSWARAQLGNLLNIKPFVEVYAGKVRRLGEARTRRKGFELLKGYIRRLGALESLAMLHTNAEAEARQILEELEPDLVFPPLVVNVTTIIGAHVGPKGVGFAAVIR